MPNRSPLGGDGEQARQCGEVQETKASGSWGWWPRHTCREVCLDPTGPCPHPPCWSPGLPRSHAHTPCSGTEAPGRASQGREGPATTTARKNGEQTYSKGQTEGDTERPGKGEETQDQESAESLLGPKSETNTQGHRKNLYVGSWGRTEEARTRRERDRQRHTHRDTRRDGSAQRPTRRRTQRRKQRDGDARRDRDMETETRAETAEARTAPAPAAPARPTHRGRRPPGAG